MINPDVSRSQGALYRDRAKSNTISAYNL